MKYTFYVPPVIFRSTFALCLFLLVVLNGSSSLFARTFTNQQGKTIEGTLLKISKKTAHIKLLKTGKVFQVPIKTLSQDDQEYIKNWKPDTPSTAKDTKNSKKKPTPQEQQAPKKQFLSALGLKEKYQLKDNFDDPWPTLVSTSTSPEITIVEENEEENRYIYHSPNYEFICDVRLSKNVIKKFSTLFESTREFCKSLPISTLKAHIPDGESRYKILLFETRKNYIKNGGPAQSNGVFIPSKDLILVPLTSLGLKKVGSGYMYDYKGSNKTLPHEITHQLTDYAYFKPGAMGWFSEGLAEYIGVTSYRSGKFMVRNNLPEIKAYVTEHGEDGTGGRALGKEITAPDLTAWMLQSYPSFVKNANFNYGLGLLITYYFFHMDEDDRAPLNAFLKGLKEGKQGEEALKLLFNGLSGDEMEKKISKAWKSKGVTIRFK